MHPLKIGVVIEAPTPEIRAELKATLTEEIPGKPQPVFSTPTKKPGGQLNVSPGGTTAGTPHGTRLFETLVSRFSAMEDNVDPDARVTIYEQHQGIKVTATPATDEINEILPLYPEATKERSWHLEPYAQKDYRIQRIPDQETVMEGLSAREYGQAYAIPTPADWSHLESVRDARKDCSGRSPQEQDNLVYCTEAGNRKLQRGAEDLIDYFTKTGHAVDATVTTGLQPSPNQQPGFTHVANSIRYGLTFYKPQDTRPTTEDDQQASKPPTAKRRKAEIDILAPTAPSDEASMGRRLKKTMIKVIEVTEQQEVKTAQPIPVGC